MIRASISRGLGDSEAWHSSATILPSPCEFWGRWGWTPPLWGGSRSTNPPGIEHHVPAKLRQVLLHPQSKTQQRSIPPSRAGIYPGGAASAQARDPRKMGKKKKKKDGVEPDPWKNGRGGMLSLRPRSGSSSPGAAEISVSP